MSSCFEPGTAYLIPGAEHPGRVDQPGSAQAPRLTGAAALLAIGCSARRIVWSRVAASTPVPRAPFPALR